MGRVASCWAVVALCMALLTAMSGCGGAESKPGMETQCTAGEACDDENPCTENDKCTGQGECIGELISCDDSRECTVDSCDPSGQCVHDLKPGFCLINGVCVADGETKPDTPCAECMVAASKTEWMNDDTNECGLEDKCHTGSHCSDGECILGTEALDCDDDNLCTDDSCDPAKGCQNVPNSSPCEHGTCVDGECQCTPDCDGKECGPDGCGSDCGTCDEGCECNEGFCATSCPTSACEPPSDDTPAETVCNGNKVMVCEQVPNCAPGVGLFGEPQDCPTGMACLGFDCACEFKSCGDEEVFECCPSNQHTCVGSQCCLPVCEGKECGPDGCGGTCGSCGADSTCDENSGKCFSVPDGMVLVPAGKFWMGCHEAIDSECLDDEYPYHEVELNAFFVDKTEVSVGAFAQCVVAGACDPPWSFADECHWSGPGASSYPRNCVDWFRAETYCQWADRRLCTEAEWEKAARGTDGRIYPWGNEVPSSQCDLAVGRGLWCLDSYTLLPVGSMPAGASPYGALDMAGSLWEWTADWYSETYYSVSPEANPTGPASGTLRILRGGGYQDFEPDLDFRTSFRVNAVSPQYLNVDSGIRCCKSP